MCEMAKLTTKQRKALPTKEFALPGKGKSMGGKGTGAYPIDTEARGRNALARASQFASPEDKAKIRSKVAQKFPGIKVKKSK
jgi:hypothetical protein